MNIRELKEQATITRGGMRVVDVERFAELVAAHEREECAKMVDNWEHDEEFVDNIADAIRARSKA